MWSNTVIHTIANWCWIKKTLKSFTKKVCENTMYINIFLILASQLIERQSKSILIAYKTWYKQPLSFEYLGADSSVV